MFQDMLSYREGRKYSKFSVPKGKAKTLIPYKRETRDKYSDPEVKKEINKFILKQNKKLSWYISETEERPEQDVVVMEEVEEEEVLQEAVVIEERDYESDEWSVESTYSHLEESFDEEDIEIEDGDTDSSDSE